MTFEQNAVLPRRFVTSVLPWLIGLGAAVVYFMTMSRWATLDSIEVVSRQSGWLWQPELNHPLAFVLYYPFRFLPEHLVPVGLNAFNAILAALTLVLLARAVALLPHDRTADQRDLAKDDFSLFSAKTAWIPPVLAAAVLGLQISFWESATAVSAEIIDTFIFAYVVRCLLEYRIDQRGSWMIRAAFLYGAGITNNWALIALAPVLLTAIVWIKGIEFFNSRFLLGMLFSGLAGLSLYLLLPLVQVISGSTPVSFSDALLANLSTQKQLLGITVRFLKENYRFFPLAATSLLPLFFIGLKWRSSFGDTSPVGILITKGVFHLVHALFFVVSLLVVFSPPYSPRQQLASLPFLGHFLNHTLLASLVVGYCSGYFLLICSPALRSRVRMNPLIRMFGYAGWSAVVLVLLLIPASLAGRNLEPVRLTNGGIMDNFIELTLSSLPAKPANLVSDDSKRLSLVRSYLAFQGRDGDFLFYDTYNAAWRDYHVTQRRQQGDRWPDTFATMTNSAKIMPRGLIAFLGQLVNSGPTYYLEPSFGYYFEVFKLEPEGLLYKAAFYSTNELFADSLPEESIAKNKQAWGKFDQQLLPKLQRWIPSDDSPRRHPAWLATLYRKLHLEDERVPTAEAVGNACSRMSTDWAARLQKQGKWVDATNALNRALILNPENVTARLTLAYNMARQEGKPAPSDVAPNIEDEFGKYQSWNDVMQACGPCDEPRFTFELGRTFFSGKLYRQSIQCIKRVVELEPTNYTANVWLADLYSMLGRPGESLKLVEHLRSQPEVFELTTPKTLNLDRLEATALFRQNRREDASAVLHRALQTEEPGVPFRAVAAQLFLQARMHAEALPLLKQIAEENPSDVRSLANLGYAYLQLGEYETAWKTLTSALELDPKNNVVRLNRAITLLRAKKYDAAKEDYLLLEQEFPKAYQVQYGLAEIAAANDNRTEALERFEECLKLSPPGTPDYLLISNRLAEISAESL